MKRISTALVLMLVSAAAFAVDAEPAGDKASVLQVVLFLVGAIGISGISCWMIWRRDKAVRAAQTAEEQRAK